MASHLTPDTGPVERLLEHNEKILDLRESIRTAKLRHRLMAWSGGAAAVAWLAPVPPTALTWRTYDMAPFYVPAVILAALFTVAFFAALEMSTAAEEGSRLSVGELELQLELALERRLMEAIPLDVPAQNRQYAHKESIPAELDKLRVESRRYRRRHNFFQMLIIIGSIGNAGAQAFSDTAQPLKSIIIGLTMLVAISAGITGYYKFRERSFNLQQTADSVEEHANAFHLGIAPYGSSDEAANLARLTEKIEALRVEQRRREQQLDQPHEGGNDTV